MVAGLILALAYSFLNGYNDSGNVVATMISSGAMTPRQALLLAGAAVFVGPFAFGVAVATAIGSGIVDSRALTGYVVLVALVATNLWSLGASCLGLPSSSSHALVGSLVGAVLAAAGAGSVQAAGLTWIVLALLVSPAMGLAASYGLLKLTLALAAGATPAINQVFKRGQVIASLALGLTHGSNDAQKTMGVIALILVVNQAVPEFTVPLWVVAASAASLALGTAVGGWRVMRTLGMKMYRVRPVHGFAAQVSAAGIILTAALLGGPVSTTHVVGSAILGAGIAERLSKVRWGVASGIVGAWVLTLPGAALTAAAIHVCWAWLAGITSLL